MAQGWCNHLWPDLFDSYSAGIKKHGMNERAITTMANEGVDISHHFSKTTDNIKHIKFDYVLTVCDSAKETCPYFPGGKIIHIGFDDPPALTKSMTNEEEIMLVYKRVCLEIKNVILNLKSIVGEK